VVLGPLSYRCAGIFSGNLDYLSPLEASALRFLFRFEILHISSREGNSMKQIKWSALLWAFLSGLVVITVGLVLLVALAALSSASPLALLALLPVFIAFCLFLIGLDVFMGYICAALSRPYGLWNSFVLGCGLTVLSLFGGIHSFLELLRLCLTVPLCMTGAILQQRYHR
jgi:hypothetical protein